jgi:ADP-ribosyl-[dinitrogen reductase] hydrolase
LAAALFAKGDGGRAAELAADVSRPTLQSPLVLDACRVWAATLTAALEGTTKTELLAMRAARATLQQRQLKPQVAALLQGEWQHVAPVEGALVTLAAALDIFKFTQSFERAVREGARVGSTCASLVGALAGAHYGSRAIPSEWRCAVAGGEHMVALANRLVR